jgi:hypothetical protein
MHTYSSTRAWDYQMDFSPAMALGRYDRRDMDGRIARQQREFRYAGG